MSPPPSRRLHERFACSIPLRARKPGSRRWSSGTLVNLSRSGALLRLPSSLSGPHLLIQIEDAEKPLSLEVRVARTARDPKDKATLLFGVVFIHDGMSERLLGAVIDGVRREAWGARTGTKDGELKRDYWGA